MLKKKIKRPQDHSANKVHPISGALTVAIIVAVFVFDQAIKYYAVMSAPFQIIPGLKFVLVSNTGISFGMLQGNNHLMVFVAIIILGILLWFHDQFRSNTQKVVYALILGGLLGNLIDRVIRGFVVDVFDLGWWPVFNLADAAISVAVLLLVVEEIFRWFSQHKKKV